ncbi:hypothetical protein GN956_G25786 [Arapaima gigas]
MVIIYDCEGAIGIRNGPSEMKPVVAAESVAGCDCGRCVAVQGPDKGVCSLVAQPDEEPLRDKMSQEATGVMESGPKRGASVTERHRWATWLSRSPEAAEQKLESSTMLLRCLPETVVSSKGPNGLTAVALNPAARTDVRKQAGEASSPQFSLLTRLAFVVKPPERHECTSAE